MKLDVLPCEERPTAPQRHVIKSRASGSTLRSPGGSRLSLPTRAFALAVAAEVAAALAAAQARKPSDPPPLSLPLTRPFSTLAFTALDVAKTSRATVVDALLRFRETDSLIANPAGLSLAMPPSLQALYEKRAEPVLERTGPLLVSRESAKQALHQIEDPFTLVAMDWTVSTTKSLALGFDLLKGDIDAESALAASRIEEDYQSDIWGEVEGAHDVDVSAASLTLSATQFLFGLRQHNPDAFCIGFED